MIQLCMGFRIVSQMSVKRVMSDELIPLLIASTDNMTCTPTVTSCSCRKQHTMPGRGEDIFRVPIKYILIPRSCINPSLLSSNCPDYLSSSSFQCLIVIFYVALICSLCECKRKLCNLVSKDSMGWTDRCTSLWWRKANVCSATRDLLAKSCAAMEAFKLSVVDAAKQKRSQLKNFVSMRSRIEQASNGLFASKKVLVAFGHCGILGGTNKKLGSLSSFVMRP